MNPNLPMVLRHFGSSQIHQLLTNHRLVVEKAVSGDFWELKRGQGYSYTHVAFVPGYIIKSRDAVLLERWLEDTIRRHNL